MIVVGIDGGEWSVIEQLWAEERLPHLKWMADQGSRAHLATEYGVSPTIWTTIATGYRAGEHGITGFVVPGPQGDVPVSSSVRRVPALWNLASLAGKRVAVLGWYATWPAETVNGFLLSDHFMRPGLDHRLYPAARLDELDARLEAIRARSAEALFPLNVARVGPRGERDVLVEELAPELAGEDFDLIMAYFRSVDHLSHLFWDHYEPEHYAEIDAADTDAKATLIPSSYERIDEVIGRIRQVAPRANVLVLSDHGFSPTPGKLRVSLDMDALLEQLGYLVRSERGVDMSRSRAFTYGSALHNPRKGIRFALQGEVAGGGVLPSEVPALKADLTRVLEGLTFEDGSPVFTVRFDSQSRHGPRLVATVQRLGASGSVFADGRPIEGVKVGVRRIPGGHAADKEGIFLAAGPSVERHADIDGIGIHDVAPTILFGMGLPVAEDFAGRAVERLFSARFRSRYPLRTVSTWRLSRDTETMSSAADEEILEELRALGYLQ